MLTYFTIAKYVKIFLFLSVYSFYFIDTKCMVFKKIFVDIKSRQFFKKEKICFVDKNSKSVSFFLLKQKQSEKC